MVVPLRPTAQIAAQLRAGATRGVVLAAEQVLTTARQRAPHEEGTLERSGAVSAPRQTGDGVAVDVSFNTPYAVRQHEELDWRHDGGRRAKYLESAKADEAQTAKALIAQAIRAALT
ncbi:hypothetical protein IF650_13060 [Cellulosimicrobium terreum]|nr:hypothetical protein [Cellulosimicrobium terreum]